MNISIYNIYTFVLNTYKLQYPALRTIQKIECEAIDTSLNKRNSGDVAVIA